MGTRLVHIYGPPAAGKLSVARELAAITGYKLFHNHLVVNAVSSLFDYGGEDYLRVMLRVRLGLIEEATRAGVNIIHTQANYRRKWDARPGVADRFGRDLERVVRAAGGTPVFVQLRPPVEVLRQRISSPSRAEHGKLVDVGRYDALLRDNEIFDTFHDDDLSIDNSDLTPSDVALKIRDAYDL